MTETEAGGSALARRFIESFNDRDLDAFTATLHPEVEIHAMRGLRKGVTEARAWATRAPGGVQQRIVLERLRERGNRVLALIVREWWWEDAEDADMAGADEMAWLFELRDGLIAAWRPFDDRAAAQEALGV